MRKRQILKITGEVQNVGFRWAALEKAQELKVVGQATNLPDGSLYIEAEGESADLEAFILWCRRGPTFASVTGFEQSEGELKNYKTFNIQ